LSFLNLNRDASKVVFVQRRLFRDEASQDRPAYGRENQGFSRDRGSGGYGDRRGGDRRGGPRPAFGNAARDPPTPKESIYVGNLYFEVKAEDLKNLFEKFGTVLEARIVADQRGMSRG
jgi:RNA recognition motif-containing protein